MSLAEFWAQTETLLGKDMTYIRKNWSWDHFSWKLRGYINMKQREREHQQQQSQNQDNE